MRGVLLFAFNTANVDYYRMAVATAKRVNQFLKLPVSVVTGPETDVSKYDSVFQNIYIETPDISNSKNNAVWINKGRHMAYQLSPYDETLVLDTDYLVNSETLLKPFELYDDFMCHKNTSLLMNPSQPQESISSNTYQTLWATVIYFKKTSRTKQIFECMKMVQDNYRYYCSVYGTNSNTYRNDYALTIALRIVNGGLENAQDYIPWKLVHLTEDVKAFRNSETVYTLVKGGSRTEYMIIKDTDFHLLSKQNFMELVNE